MPNKLMGKTVAFVGKFSPGADLDDLKELVAAEGGSVVDPAKVLPDYLVAGRGVGGKPPAIVAKLQKKHPQLRPIDTQDFYLILAPTAAEFEQLMLSGNSDHRLWYKLENNLANAGVMFDLSGRNYRNQHIVGLLRQVCLDDCDFSDSKIDAHFGDIKNARFDGCTLHGGSLQRTEDCSLQNVTLLGTRWSSAVFTRCDFTGSTLPVTTGFGTVAMNCTFQRADCRGAQFPRSSFVANDFSEANLSGAELTGTNFTRANLAGADLSGANLRHCNFMDANLAGANFASAVLDFAILKGANIEGADFAGAQLGGVDLTSLDVSLAKNLQKKLPRAAGPHLLQLTQVATQAKSLQTSLELDLSDGEYVVLQPSIATQGSSCYISAHYQLGSPDRVGKNCGGMGAATLHQTLLDLRDKWPRGRPKFETVTVEATKCPLRGTDLEKLAVAAWAEACGVAIPTDEELAAARQQAADALASQRAPLLADLHGGEQGVAQWNARPLRERRGLDKLRQHDFSNAKLAGVHLNELDLEGCNFTGADLTAGRLQCCQLKETNFTSANLAGAKLTGSQLVDATFAGANLQTCALGGSDFRRANLQNADLTGADFSQSDLSAADLTGATLTSVNFVSTTFNEKTFFPPGFNYPAGLIWKGKGPRPGSPPPPPLPTGSLAFDAFIAKLNLNVEKGRMDNATSMLKKASFQLFAEVKDDSLGGIVKSQSDANLVYSCRLTSTGAFGCCTQNLRYCGGLRGALCKHLLVLIIGLAKAGQLDAATVDHWIELSKHTRPAIQEDEMSATFLKYKGAEAGEIDWRPTETIPEDFYSM